MKRHIDGCRVMTGEHKMALTGWAVPASGEARLSYSLFDGKGAPRGMEQVFRPRPDISNEFLGDPYRDDAAFYFEFPYEKGEKLTLRISETKDGEVIASDDVKVSASLFQSKENLRKIRRSLDKPFALLKKVRNKLTHGENKSYHEWFLRHAVMEEEEKAERARTFSHGMKFSVVVPVYRTPERLLIEMAESVLASTYSNLELILANASGDDPELEKGLKSLSERDGRVKVLTLPENGGIARNTNEAINAASGEFIAFLDHDDLITKDALFRFAEALEAHPDADVLYSDEDKVTEDSTAFFDPNFKPDYDPVLLTVSQYVCHFTAVRASLLKKAGLLDPEYDGAQDHDLMLRLSEVTDRFVHVPRVLYHWRSTAGSTAKGRGQKAYAEDAGVRAVNAHFKRLGIPAAASKGAEEGRYHLSFRLAEKPLVSVLIPNRDHAEDLTRAVMSLFETATYGNLEVLVIENNSEDEGTFHAYETLEKTYHKLRVLKAAEGPFHYAKIHNEAVKEAKGEYLLLLNNDTEVLTPDYLEMMVGLSLLPGAGAVGAKLLYPDRTVQHAGIVTGEGGIAFHPFKGTGENEPGYMCRAVTTMSVSAVTGACLLVKKSLYEEVGGMDERLAVALNDVDLCFKIRAEGKRVVIASDAFLTHYESKSRGSEETKENFIRYGEEIRYFADKWKGTGMFPDPYYPAVFSLLSGYQRKE